MRPPKELMQITEILMTTEGKIEFLVLEIIAQIRTHGDSVVRVKGSETSWSNEFKFAIRLVDLVRDGLIEQGPHFLEDV